MAISQADIIKMMKEFGENEADWAKTSKYYGRIMSDGNVFNPYLHRRFLPTQFKNLVTYSFRSGSAPTEKQFIKNSAGAVIPTHVVDCVTKEVNLLAFLEKRDEIAFEERSALMPLKLCKQAYVDFMAYLKDHYSLSIWRAPDFADEFEEYVTKKIPEAKTYAELDEVLNAPWKTLFPGYGYNQKHVTVAKVYQCFWYGYHSDFSCDCCRKFYDLYLLSGAYYSLKNYYMFNDDVDRRREKLKVLYETTVSHRDWSELINRYARLMGISGAIEEKRVA